MSARHPGVRLLTATVWLATLGYAPQARAQPPLALTWRAPADCPTAQSVTRAVEMLITKPPAHTLEASANIGQEAERFTAEIRTPRGERRLDGESCRAVSEAVAMVLALAIDPDASPSTAAFASFDEPDAKAPAPEREPKSEPRPPESKKEAQSPPTDRSTSAPRTDPPEGDEGPTFLAALFVLAELGMLPQPTLGASLGVGLRMSAWSAEIGPMILVPRSGALENDKSRGGEIGYMGGYAAGCLSPFRSRRFDFCGAFEVGRLYGTGFGVTNELTGQAVWLAPALAAAVRLPVVGPFQGEARLVTAVALHRPEFELDDLGQVHQPALLSVRGELGFSWR